MKRSHGAAAAELSSMASDRRSVVKLAYATFSRSEVGSANRAPAAGGASRRGPVHRHPRPEEEPMGLIRGRRGGDSSNGRRHFQMREQMMSIGDDYWIEDDAGRRAYHVDGKAIRIRDTW